MTPIESLEFVIIAMRFFIVQMVTKSTTASLKQNRSSLLLSLIVERGDQSNYRSDFSLIFNVVFGTIKSIQIL